MAASLLIVAVPTADCELSWDAPLGDLEPHVKAIRHAALDHDRSYGARVNAAAESEVADMLLIVDARVAHPLPWLGGLIETLENDERCAAVSPVLATPAGYTAQCGYVFSGALDPRPLYEGLPVANAAVRTPRVVQALGGTCVLLRRSCFDAVGGFDPEYRTSYADIDLSLRLRGLGASLRVDARWVAVCPGLAPAAAPADVDHDRVRFHGRWRAEVVADEATTYLTDGLLTIEPDASGVRTFSISPLLGEAAPPSERVALRLLSRRAREVAALRSYTSQMEDMFNGTGPGLPDPGAISSDSGYVDRTDPDWLLAHQYPLAAHWNRRTAPLRVTLAPHQPRRVNLFIGSLKVRQLFGGFATVLQLAQRLIEHGERVRLVSEDGPNSPAKVLKPALAEIISDQAIRHLEVADVTNTRRLEVSPGDSYIASSIWTAHLAQAAVTATGGRPFAFLMQDDELLFLPNGSFAAATREGYGFPHKGIFSTELLRDWFAEQRRSVFSDGFQAIDGRDYVTFRNAIVDPGPPSRSALERRHPRRVLFYARSASTEARNLFELGWASLVQAVEEGVFDDGEWEFTGIGSPAPGTLELGRGRTMHLAARMDRAAYRGVLRAHDVGLSLMDSPHPSLVPIEMAMAGLTCVTSTYGPKDEPALAAISPNLVGKRPTKGELVAGLAEAVARSEQVDRRLAGSEATVWSRSAAEAFDDDLLTTVTGWLGER